MNQAYPPQTRQQLHTRTITCEAFAHGDGLVDIEGTLLDIKHHQIVLPERGVVAPGEAVHEMKLVITIDRSFVIHDKVLEGDTVNRPTPLGGCHALSQNGEVVKLYFPQHYQQRESK